MERFKELNIEYHSNPGKKNKPKEKKKELKSLER
jgi:hypothetical protein